MNVENVFKNRLRGKALMKVVKILALIIVVLIVLVIMAIPGFVSSGKCRQIILDKVNKSVPGKMEFASLSMGWFQGFTVKDFSFNDNAGSIFVKVKQITTKPLYGSLLVGDLAFGKTVIDQPQVELTLLPLTPAAGAAAKPAAQPSAKSVEPVKLPVSRIDLVVENGDVKVTDKRSASAKAGTVELSNINTKLNLQPAGSTTQFAVNMEVGQGGKESKITAQGNVTPSSTGWSLEGTTGELTVEVTELDLSTLAPLLAMAGADIQTQGNISIKTVSKVDNGKVKNVDGVITGKDLLISSAAWKGDKLTTKTLDVNVKLHGEKEFINIDELKVSSDWLSAKAAGVVPVSMKSLDEYLKPESTYSLKGDFDCDIAKIFAQIPHVLGVQEGMKITSGKVNGNVGTFTEAGHKGLRAQAALSSVAGTVSGKQVTLPGDVKLDAQIASDKGVVTFDKLNVSAPFASVNCSGTTELIKYSADADLAKVQDQVGQFVSFGKYKMAGEFTSNGQVSMKKEKITASASSAIKDLNLSTAQGVSAVEPAAKIDFAVAYESDKKIARVESLKVGAGFGQLSVDDAVLPLSTPPAEQMKLTASVSDLDLAKLQPFMVLLAALPKDMQLAGIVKSKVAVTSKKDTYHVATDATSIKNLKVVYPGQQPFEQTEISLIVDADINPTQQTIAVKKLQLTSPLIKVKGDFEKSIEGDQGKLQGQVSLDYDWAAVSTIAAPYLPKGMRIKGQRNDTIKFSSSYPLADPNKMLANLNANAKVGFQEVDYMGLVVGATEVQVMANNGMLMIPAFSAPVNNGQFNFAGEANFKQKPAFLKTSAPIQVVKDVQITDQMGKELLSYVNPLFANAAGLSGTFNFNCEKFALPIVGGTKNDIEIIGTIAADKVKLGSSGLLSQLMTATSSGSSGGEVTIHPTKFTLQKGFVRYDDMQVDIGRNPFTFKGAIGLDKSLNMSVTVPYGAGGKVKTGQVATAQRYTVPLTGTTDKPKLDVSGLMQDIAKKQVEQQLQKSLEGFLKKR